MKEESNYQLPLVEWERNSKHIRFNETTVEREGTTLYTYDHVRVAKNAGRGDIIDAIVRYRYSQSQMEAIVNNYLKAEHTAEEVQAFDDMQAWRAAAKVIATEVLTVTAGEE